MAPSELGSPHRIMVTGASGFVGQKLVSRLAECLTEACVIPVHGPQRSDGLVSVDLADAEACLKLVQDLRPTAIVHLAALSSVGTTTNSPAEIWRSNFDGTRALAKAALSLANGVRFIFASSGEVYGSEFNNGPCDERKPLAPASPYARTKAACEYFLRDHSSEQFSVIVLRLFNHSGAGQDERFVVPSLAAQIARAETEGRHGQIKVGNLDASRDFSDIEDILDAYITVILHEAPLPHFSVFNLGSGRNRTIQSVLDTLMSLAAVTIDPVTDLSRMRSADIAFAQGVFDRFREEFGWTPKRDFDRTIAHVLDFQRARLRLTAPVGTTSADTDGEDDPAIG